MKRVQTKKIDSFFVKKVKIPESTAISSELVTTSDSQPSVISENVLVISDDVPTTSSSSRVSHSDEEQSPQFHKNDIGQYVNKIISDETKEELLRHTWSPNKKFNFTPQIAKNGKKRYFQLKWLERYNWLSYSAYSNGAHCKFCFLFANKDGIGKGKNIDLGSLVILPYTNWKDAIENFDRHSGNRYHKEAAIKAHNFLMTFDDVSKSLDVQLRKQSNENIEAQRYKLRVIIETILLCGRQGLALRGHNEGGQFSLEEPANNDGNFRALLRYRAKGDDLLRKSFENAPKNASYNSPLIQNEIIQIIGKEIQKNIIIEINKSGFFSILADETTDISGKEQLTLCIRYFDENAGKIKECFMSYIEIKETTGNEISQTLLEQLIKFGLNLNLLRGQGYDGAANMSGRYNGVQAIISKKYPTAIYVHCASHILNLCLNSASKLPEIRNTYGTINEVCAYFRSSTKRTNILLSVLKEEGKPEKRLRLYCETRWVERHDCIQLFYESMPEIITALEKMDEKGCSIGKSLHNRICKFDFILSVAVCSFILNITYNLSKYLQSVNLDIVKAYGYVHDVINRFNNIRQDVEKEFNRLYDEVTEITETFGITPELPRRVGTQKYRSNIPADSPIKYYRTTLFIPYLDEIISSLTDRFSNYQNVNENLYKIVPSYVVNLTSKDFENVIEFYKNDFKDGNKTILAEIDLWIDVWRNKTELPSNPMDSILKCDKDIFPNIHVILKILLVIPVTTATAERSFSTLRRVKTYLRNCMEEERLSSLALISMYRDEVDINAIINSFLLKNRRLDF